MAADTGCAPTVFLDGMRIARGGDAPAAMDAVNLIPAFSIEGIEVHTPASVPAEFSGSQAGCGVVAIWTRRQ